MFQDSIIIKNKHKKFIQEIVKNEVVLALKSNNGFATSISNKHKSKEGIFSQIICFWSNKKLAKICLKKYWKEYRLYEIDLSDFIENWCIGMYQDNLLAGTNFDYNLFGNENEPLELIIEISNEIKKIGKNIYLDNFKSLDLLINELKNIS